jgi:hypothetical protein
MSHFNRIRLINRKGFAVLAIVLLPILLLPLVSAGAGDANASSGVSKTGQSSSSSQLQDRIDSNPDNQNWFLLVAAIIIVVTIFSFYPLFMGIKELSGIASGTDNKSKITKGGVLAAFGAVLVISCLSLLTSLINLKMNRDIIMAGSLNNTTIAAIVGTGNTFTIVLPALLGLLVFGAVLFMLYVHFNLREQEPGSMRKTIAGLLTVGLVIVVFFALIGKISNEPIITQYIQLVAVIIAFYFGSRSAASEKPEEDDVIIEKVTFNRKDKKLAIRLSNKGGKNLSIGKVILEKEGTPEKIEKSNLLSIINSAQKEADISVDMGEDVPEPGKKYKITIETTPLGPKTCVCLIEMI